MRKIIMLAAAPLALGLVAGFASTSQASSQEVVLSISVPKIIEIPRPTPYVSLIQFSEYVSLSGGNAQKLSGNVKVYKWDKEGDAPQIWEKIFPHSDFPESGHGKTLKYEHECQTGQYYSRWHFWGFAEGQYGEMTIFFPHKRGDESKPPDRVGSWKTTCQGKASASHARSRDRTKHQSRPITVVWQSAAPDPVTGRTGSRGSFVIA